MNRSEKGNFLVFFVVSLGLLLALVGLVIDGGRILISSNENKQLAEIAASEAIKDYVTFNPKSLNGDPLTPAQIHEAKLQHAKTSVQALVSDDLNRLFGNPSGAISVVVDGSFTEGLLLTPGEYFQEIDQMPAGALKSSCVTKRNTSKIDSCWVKYGVSGNTGVNSFRAEVLTESTSAIKGLFSGFTGLSDTRLKDEGFSFLKPRYFLNLIDLSNSVTEGNFNLKGRYRSKFVFKRTDGGSSSGSGCISPLGSISPSCNFGANSPDDMIWNAEFYANNPSIDDDRCIAGQACPLASLADTCSGTPVGYDPNWFSGSWNFTNIYTYEWGFRDGDRTGSNDLNQGFNPRCSPVFWAGSNVCGDGTRSIRSCFSNTYFSGFANNAYGWRYLGDQRVDASDPEFNGLVKVPLNIDQPPGTWGTSSNPWVARQPSFLRFKEDYRYVNVPDSPRAKVEANGRLTPRVGTNFGGDLLYELPNNLRNYQYGDFGTGVRIDDTNLKPPGYFFMDSVIGLSDEAFTGGPHKRNETPPFPREWRSTDTIGTPYSTRGSHVDLSFRGFFLPRRQPSYEGPEPYNSILKGLSSMHTEIAQQNVPGDRFGALFFDSALTAFKTQVPLVPVIRAQDITSGTVVTTEQEPLRDTLVLVKPDAGFATQGRIEARLRRGLYPDSNADETNISFATSQAIQYLKGIPNFKGADVYLNLFTDFVAFANCYLQAGVSDAKITECNNALSGVGNRTNLNTGAPGKPYTFMGMLNDLIGWPEVGDEPQGSHQAYGAPYIPGNPDFPVSISDRREGLIKYMSKLGITPIFFGFNGTIGGEIVYPNHSGSGCMTKEQVASYRDPVSEAALERVRGRESDHYFYFWASGIWIPGFNDKAGLGLGTEGGMGNFYAPVLGDLLKPLLAAKGDLIQLNPPCPNTTLAELQAVFPARGNIGTGIVDRNLTAFERLEKICDYFDSGSTKPEGLNFFSFDSRGQSVFDSRWFQQSPSSIEWYNFKVKTGVDGVTDRINKGLSLQNAMYDFGASPKWTIWCSGLNGSYSNSWCHHQRGYDFPWEGAAKGLWRFREAYPEEAPLSLSGEGGLRCEPRTEMVDGQVQPLSINSQIKETIVKLLRQPNVAVVSNPNIVQ